ncbi:MAG: hypothetical protein K6G26_01190, partial [Lachnospiraceae bacterium]|nr:hypothetical protein [Lachnospiraceae bacterium]
LKIERKIFNELALLDDFKNCTDLKYNIQLYISDNNYIVPDFYSEGCGAIGEIYVHIGKLKSSQQDKIASDILKMLSYEKISNKSLTKYVVIRDNVLNKQLTGKSFLAESIRIFGIKLLNINIDDTLRDELLKTMKRQDITK